MTQFERTLVVLKPDAVKRGLVGEIIARFEKAGLIIVGLKMVRPDRDHYYAHYETIGKLVSRVSPKVFEINLELMNEGPVVAFVLEGISAVKHVRKMVGTTDPQEAAPGTIRGDYTHITRDYANANETTLPNLIHASGSLEDATAEIALWFKTDELFDYETAHASIVHGRRPNNG